MKRERKKDRVERLHRLANALGRMTDAEAGEMLMARWGSLLQRLGRGPQ